MHKLPDEPQQRRAKWKEVPTEDSEKQQQWMDMCITMLLINFLNKNQSLSLYMDLKKSCFWIIEVQPHHSNTALF